MRGLKWLVLVTTAALFLSACGARSQQPAANTSGSGSTSGGGGTQYTMKIGNTTSKDAQDDIAHKFAEAVGKHSNGQIKATVHSGSSLGNDQQMNRGVQSGSIEAIIQPTGFMAPFVPEMGVLDLPYLIPVDIRKATEFMNMKGGQELMRLAEEQGFHIASFFSIGNLNFSTTFPVDSVESLKGRKFRVIQSPEKVGAYKAWNANAVGMALAEVYTAFQQRTIEGMENPPDIFVRMKFFEVVPYYTISQHSNIGEVIAVSKKWYDTLPKNLQEAVDKAGEEINTVGTDIYSKAQAEQLEKVKEVKGLTVSILPQAERDKLKSMGLETVWKDIAQDPKKGPILKLLQEDLKTLK